MLSVDDRAAPHYQNLRSWSSWRQEKSKRKSFPLLRRTWVRVIGKIRFIQHLEKRVWLRADGEKASSSKLLPSRPVDLERLSNVDFDDKLDFERLSNVDLDDKLSKVALFSRLIVDRSDVDERCTLSLCSQVIYLR